MSSTSLLTSSYLDQVERIPKTGRHIIAQYDDQSVIVYQAYSQSIAHFALEHGYFGGPFKLTRMSWIKPNFLWMMYRSGWGSKEGQETVLAVRIRRDGFDQLLSDAVHSNYTNEVYTKEAEWTQAVSRSSVRLQWDPDHHPDGSKLDRRAIQLGLRRDKLALYAREWILGIEDISTFVQEQSQKSLAGEWEQLVVPQERVYPAPSKAVAERLQLDTFDY